MEPEEPTGLMERPPNEIAPGSLDAIEGAVANVVSEVTKKIYLRDIRAFIRELDVLLGLSPEAATYDDLLRWWGWLRQRKDRLDRSLKPATVNRRLSAVKRFYKEGLRRGHFATNPAEGVPSLRVSKEPQGRALTARESQALLDACPTSSTLADLRDRLAVSFLLFTGCRVSELCRVRLEHFTTSSGRRLVEFHRKRGKVDWQVIAPDLSMLIDAWQHRAKIMDGALLRAVIPAAGGIQVVRDGALHRRTLHKIVKTRAKLAGLGEDVGPHDVRKTYVSACAALGIDVVRIASAVGHSDVKTTQLYVHQHDMHTNHPSDKVEQWVKGQGHE